MALFVCACSSMPNAEPEISTEQNYLPRYSILVRDSVYQAKSSNELPKRVYLFPPLQMDALFRPLGELKPWTSHTGSLSWISAAPSAGEIQHTVSSAISKEGYQILTFDQLLDIQIDHDAMVLNLYFSKPREELHEGLKTGHWLVSLRLSASTFPASLDPQLKKDLMRIDALVLFEAPDQYEDAVKRSFRWLVSRMKSSGTQTKLLQLLD